MNSIPEIKWLTVDEALVICVQQNLSRTKKTIRNWCRRGDLEAQKKTTSTGEQWFVELASLNVKIEQELQFEKSRSNFQTVPERSEQVQVKTEPFQQGANPSEPFRSATDDNPKEEIQSLKTEIQSLKIDKGIRDAQIKFLEDENIKGRDTLSAQSRYIGHLETIALSSGASPDAKFLASPVPNSENETDLPVGDFETPEAQNLGYNYSNGNRE